MALPVVFASLAAGSQPLSLLDQQSAALGNLGAIACACSGTNSLTLTPLVNTPTLTSYVDLQPSFVFVASQTSTGTVTANVGLLGSRNLFKWNGSVLFGNIPQCGAGDIIAGNIYRLTPLAALGGSGGFVCDTFGAGSNNAEFQYVIDGGGSPITTGVKGFLRMPRAAVINSWFVMADVSGSVSVDILRASGAIPSASIVGSGNKPTLTAQQFATAVPSGWTSTLLAGGDIIGFNVISAATVTRITVDLSLGWI